MATVKVTFEDVDLFTVTLDVDTDVEDWRTEAEDRALSAVSAGHLWRHGKTTVVEAGDLRAEVELIPGSVQRFEIEEVFEPCSSTSST